MSQSASSTDHRGEAQRTAADLAIRCRQCGTEQAPAPLCASCVALLPLPVGADHFQVFGIPRRLDLDVEALSHRYYELSRLLHPDRHATGSAEARERSMQSTAALTRAYRCLRDPVSRALHWLELHGESLGDDNRVPPQLAALVFQVQENLEELRAAKAAEQPALAAAVRTELGDLVQQRESLMQQIQDNARAWESPAHDTPALLRDLKSLLSRRAYLGTLIRDVERALQSGPELRVPN